MDYKTLGEILTKDPGAWAAQFPYVAEEADERSEPVSFRLKGRYVRLMEELKDRSDSPFHGLFRTKSDLPKYLVVKGLEIMVSLMPQLANEVTPTLLLEAQASRIAFRQDRIAVMGATVKTLVKNLTELINSGFQEDAAVGLDEFLTVVGKMDNRWKKEYLKVLTMAPEYARIKGELTGLSFLLGEIEA